MRTVSASYDPYPDVRYSDVRVSFRLIDLLASADASAAATEYNTDISQLAQLSDEVERLSAKWGTLEPQGWILNGTSEVLPASVAGYQTGLWSVQSDENGDFATDPTLTFTFDDDHSSIGFTVIFDEWTSARSASVTVASYDASNVLIGTNTVAVTSDRMPIDLLSEDYRKVVFTFTGTIGGYQRFRIAEVVFGIVEYYDSNNMTAASIIEEISPNGSATPISELAFTIDNSDAKYNMRSPDSFYAYLQTGQPIDAEIMVGKTSNSEYTNCGRFYFAKSESDDDALTAKITAYDRLYQLGKTKTNIGATGTWTVSAAVAAVIADSGMDITAIIPSPIGSRVIGKAIPQGTYHKEALRLIAQAGQSTCFVNRDDQLEFYSITTGTSVDTLDGDNMQRNAKITVTDRINTVILTADDEYADTETTETIYTAADVPTGETVQALSVTNPLGTQATADWLLEIAQNRLVYETSERGNPAIEMGDAVTVYDAYGTSEDCVKIKQQFDYSNGRLSVSGKGWA